MLHLLRPGKAILATLGGRLMKIVAFGGIAPIRRRQGVFLAGGLVGARRGQSAGICAQGLFGQPRLWPKLITKRWMVASSRR